jgi:methylmalonyl-CoA mutase N-terminal domain/subunit
VLRIDPELERQQIERLNGVRGRRDGSATREALNRIENAARGEDNLMPRIIRAVEASATLGEISDRLRAVFGEYRAAGE